MKWVAILYGLGLFSISVQALAYRCGTELVTEGDTEYTLQKACGSPDAVSGDIWGGKKTLTYEKEGGAETVEILNGKITNIEFNRR